MVKWSRTAQSVARYNGDEIFIQRPVHTSFLTEINSNRRSFYQMNKWYQGSVLWKANFLIRYFTGRHIVVVQFNHGANTADCVRVIPKPLKWCPLLTRRCHNRGVALFDYVHTTSTKNGADEMHYVLVLRHAANYGDLQFIGTYTHTRSFLMGNFTLSVVKVFPTT